MCRFKDNRNARILTILGLLSLGVLESLCTKLLPVDLFSKVWLTSNFVRTPSN